MRSITNLFWASLSLVILALLASCQDEDFGYTAQQIKTSRFAKNFEAEYGAIDPEQSWDLTHYMYRTSNYENSMLDFLLHEGQTRATDSNGVEYKNPESGDLGYYEGGYYIVQDQTIRWLRNYLKEGKNNTDLGKAFTMVAPDNKFAIIPIYQGFADMDWSLHMKANGVDTKIWQKSENILVRDSDSEEWRTVGTTYGTSQTIYNHQIKSKPILIDFHDASVKDFSLSLHIDTGKAQYANTGTDQTSSAGMMLALSCPIPGNVGTTGKTPNYAMVIGCEDANLESSDWDLNDVCFLIVGYPMIPDRVNMTSKRYMCEDLGNTYDFDFNDIVVDVTEIEREHYDPSTNDFVPTTDGKKQFATIKHLCGTIPFQVTVGDYTFPAVSDPTNHAQTLTELGDSFRPVAANNGTGVDWDPGVVKQITGWNDDENNITIKVVKDGNTNTDVFNDKFGDNLSVKEDKASEHLYILNFPGRGEAPLILATDQTTPWKAEHVHIDPAWWQDGEHRPTNKEQEEDPGQGGGSGGGSSATIPESLVTTDDDGNAVIWEAPADFDGWNSGSWGGMQVQTPFLDAVFEGYTILEIQFADSNTAHQFRFIKVRNDWENYIDAQITDGKFVHLFTGDIMSTDEYNLGFAMMMDESGGKLVPSKIIMRKPTYYNLTIGSAEHGSVTISGTANSEGKYAYGSTVTLTATPEEGWYFDQWSDGNKSNPRQLTITGDVELTPSYSDNDPFEAGNVILKDAHTFGNDWTNFDINKSVLNLHQGDEIVFRVTSYSADAAIEFFNLNWGSKRVVTPAGGINGSFVVEITQEMYNDYKDGLKIQGHNVSLESITKRCTHTDPETPEEPDTVQQDITLGVECNFVATKWQDAAKISASQLSGIEVGDKFVITLKDVENGAQMQVSEMSGDWSNKIVSAYNLDGSTSKEIEVNSSNIDAIKNGMAIQGHDFTLVKVELEKKTPDPETNDPVELITNGDLEGDDFHNFKYTIAADNNWGATITSGNLSQDDDSHGKFVNITASRSGNNADWETKFTIDLGDALPAGSSVTIKFDYKVNSNSVDISLGTNDSGGNYAEYIDGLSFSTDWKTFEKTITTTKSLKQIEMSLATDNGVGKTFYFDNISVIKN